MYYYRGIHRTLNYCIIKFCAQKHLSEPIYFGHFLSFQTLLKKHCVLK